MNQLTVVVAVTARLNKEPETSWVQSNGSVLFEWVEPRSRFIVALHQDPEKSSWASVILGGENETTESGSGWLGSYWAALEDYCKMVPSAVKEAASGEKA